MERYKTGKKLFAESRFQSAKNHFEAALEKDLLEESEKIDCLEKIIRLNEILKKEETSFLYKISLADLYIERKDYFLASKILQRVVENRRNYEYSFKLIKSYLNEGNISYAETEVVNLFIYLYKKKNFEKTFELYSFCKESLDENRKFDSFYLLGIIQSGNIEEFEEKSFLIKDDFLMEALVGVDFKHWRHSNKFNSLLATEGFSQIDYNLNKEGIKTLLESLLLGRTLESREVEASLRYFLKVERKTISRLLCNYGDQKDYIISEQLVNKIDSLPEDIKIPDFDFGEDLFKEEEDNKTEVSKIISDIEMLESLGEEAEAKILKIKLRKLDPENNTFLNREDEHKKTIEEVEEEWDILNQEDSHSFRSLEAVAKATVKSLRDDELLKSYKDLIYCFNTMKLSSVSLQIIEKLDKFNLIDERDVLRFNYLKIKTLLESNDPFQAYDLITELNGTVIMNQEEKLEFLYLQGEIALKLERKKDAYKCFNLVKKIDPNYRLVKRRLEDFG